MPIESNLRPGHKWEFDREVTTNFDEMLRRSIPGYETMRRTVTDLALSNFVDGTDVVDLGCSRGEALAPLVAEIGKRARQFVGVEVSKPMLEAAHVRFYGEEWDNVRILDLDLRRDYPEVDASVTLSVLTLQFTPIEYRLRILRNAWKRTCPGGIFLLVEKVLGASAEIDEEFVRLYYEMKQVNGYTEEEIERKRLALEGVLVPVTAAWNEDLLRRSGFSEVDCFWRELNFAGWIAVK